MEAEQSAQDFSSWPWPLEASGLSSVEPVAWRAWGLGVLMAAGGIFVVPLSPGPQLSIPCLVSLKF